MNCSKLSKCLLFASLLLTCSTITAAESNLQPATTEIKVLKDSDRTCFSTDVQKQLEKKNEQLLNDMIIPQLYGLYKEFPTNSCADIYRDHPSGYYWLNIDLQPQLVYCSINENPCCNDSDTKWMRIAYLNMSHPTAQCPHPWRELDSPIRTCRRQFNTSISSVSYSSYGIPYSKVCGRFITYQFGTPEAFLGYKAQNQSTLDNAYVDGISITYGQHPRNHIWTFAAARGTFDRHICPCSSDRMITTPSFINNDYFCERGTISESNLGFIADDPLWDGHSCTGSSTCCEFNNPPWFCKQIPEPTTEDIEIRICGYVKGNNILEEEDSPVQLIEIYVK